MTTIREAQDRAESVALRRIANGYHKFGTECYQWSFDWAYDREIRKIISAEQLHKETQ